MARRSTDDTCPTTNTTTTTRSTFETLTPQDFDDVFGGPPRTVLSRQFSIDSDFTRSRTTTTSLLFDHHDQNSTRLLFDNLGRDQNPPRMFSENMGRNQNAPRMFSDNMGRDQHAPRMLFENMGRDQDPTRLNFENMGRDKDPNRSDHDQNPTRMLFESMGRDQHAPRLYSDNMGRDQNPSRLLFDNMGRDKDPNRSAHDQNPTRLLYESMGRDQHAPRMLFDNMGRDQNPTRLNFEKMGREKDPNRSDGRSGFWKDHRMLPEFKIPASKVGYDDDGFYGDIFGEDERRSRSRSKSKSRSKSSSVLSSEELSPFRPVVGGGGGEENDGGSFSSFAAKLRPINVSSNWNTTKKMHEVQPMADSPSNSHSFKGYYSGFSQKLSSPEITTFGPNSYTTVKESIEDLQVNSPASIVSSLNQDHGDETSTIFEEDDDEIMSAFVIEINPSKNHERARESVGVDDAIAWANQKCQTRNVEKEYKGDEEHECPEAEEMHGVNDVPDVQINELSESSSLDKEKVWTTEEPLKELAQDVNLCKQMELELLDEDIKLWSEGKETNIRLLLSTLHHILWPSSGWIMIPLTNLKDSPNVKKAYQKARLCLHPDKLQQRGVTISQKYVADKAFPILQDAWAAFISQDVLFSIT